MNELLYFILYVIADQIGLEKVFLLLLFFQSKAVDIFLISPWKHMDCVKWKGAFERAQKYPAPAQSHPGFCSPLKHSEVSNDFVSSDGPYQSAGMHRLIWAFAVHICPDRFLHGVAHMLWYNTTCHRPQATVWCLTLNIHFHIIHSLRFEIIPILSP